MNSTRGVLYFLASQTCLVIDGVAVHHLGPVVLVDQLTLLRGIGAAVLVGVLARRTGWLVFHTTQLPMQIIRGLLTLVSLWAIFYALAHLPLADAAAITYSRPVFMTLLGVVLLGEAVSSRRWLATAVSFGGALVVIGRAFTEWHPAYLIALVGAAINAGAVVATKYLGRQDSPQTILTYLALVSIVFSIMAVVRPWPWQEWLALLVVAISGALGLWFGLLAVREADVSLLAPYDYARLPLYLLIGIGFFGEIPGTMTLLGAGLIVLSGVILLMRERRHTKV